MLRRLGRRDRLWKDARHDRLSGELPCQYGTWVADHTDADAEDFVSDLIRRFDRPRRKGVGGRRTIICIPTPFPRRNLKVEPDSRAKTPTEDECCR